MQRSRLAPMSRPVGRCRRHPAPGFTLVEILVVIVIIALLAAIALPIMSKVKETGRRVACTNNLQQLGLGFRQYVQDYGRYPGPGNFQAWGNGGHWVAGTNDPICPSPTPGCLADISPPYKATGAQALVEKGAIFEYVKEPKVYFCPSNADGSDKRLSYSMNCALAGLRINKIDAPQDIVLLVDEEAANDGYFFATDDKASSSPGKSTDALTVMHNGGGNLLFVDGHVKYYNPISFPLDVSPQGQQNKYWYPGNPAYPTVSHPGAWPRFHDKAFGAKGSAYPALFGSSGYDSCAAPIP
ncbi:MAG: DUF1559 domain-containing protein [Abitibacteriaceae bacterium]|nr:DUF1559 domain-containing protein [Abditibacteriaceae bacterium]